LLTAAALALPLVASAQDDTPKAVPALLGAGIIGFILIIGLAFYVYVALALQTIAQKTNTENAWFAWIPIANIILGLTIAKKPIWWIVLFLIPFVGIVMAVLMWMGIAEARNKPSWWGIMVIVPVMNLIMPGYLAWSD
jgi:dolichyl-phosphate-mannose--protein O-mannosyl transferase